MWLQIAILLSTALCAAISVAWWFTEPVLRFGGFDAAQARLAGTFARYSILGLWPNVMYTLVRLFLLAQQDVIPSVIVAVVCAVGNVGLNQLFIHGAFGWGGLGFIGSPIATATTRVLLLVMLGSYAFCLKRYEHPTWSGWSRGCLVKSRWHSFVVTQALPQMISAALEEWQLQVIAFLAARLGEVQIATHNSVINLFYVLTSMMYGMISATKYDIMGCCRGYTSVSSPVCVRVCAAFESRSTLVVGTYAPRNEWWPLPVLHAVSPASPWPWCSSLAATTSDECSPTTPLCGQWRSVFHCSSVQASTCHCGGFRRTERV